MSKAYEGYFSIYENGDWGNGTPYYPQAIPVESETLGVQQDIRVRENLVGDGRGHSYQSMVPLAQAPKGALSYAFRSDDSLKVFLSHFQCGSFMGSSSGTYHYALYPSKGNPSFFSAYPADVSYGGTGGVFSVGVLKRLTQSGTNSLFYKHGICDTLQVAWSANDELRLNADFFFKSVDTGTSVTVAPAGSYSPEHGFHSSSGTVQFNSSSFDVESLSLRLKNNLEVSANLGTKNPEYFKFGRHTVSGELGLDFPTDGLKYVSQMIGTQSFSISVESYLSGTSRVVFTLPNCVLTPFETNVGNEEYTLRLPFRAFDSGTLPSVQVDVYTAYDFNGLNMVFDAEYGARTLANYDVTDSEYGTRTLSSYEIADRDLY